jgi:glycine betaine/choline ABC-type transport system substrate-binding protein
MLSIATLNISASLVCERSFARYSNFILQLSKAYKMHISKNVRKTLKAGTTIAAIPSGDPWPPMVFWIVKTDKGIVCRNIS